VPRRAGPGPESRFLASDNSVADVDEVDQVGDPSMSLLVEEPYTDRLLRKASNWLTILIE
jgi:hypothetical protein